MMGSPSTRVPPPQPEDVTLRVIEALGRMSNSVTTSELASAMAITAASIVGATSAVVVAQRAGSLVVEGQNGPVVMASLPEGLVARVLDAADEGGFDRCASGHWSACRVPRAEEDDAVLLLNTRLEPEAELQVATLIRFASNVRSTIAKFELLESMVAQEMTTVVEREESIELILNSISDGLFTCGLDGAVTGFRSLRAVDWLGEPTESDTFWSLLSPDDDKRAQTLRLGYEQLTAGVFPFEVAAAQMPQHLHRGEQTFELALHPAMKGGALTGVVVALRDVTEIIAAHQSEQECRELAFVIRLILRDAAAFADSIRHLQRLLKEVLGGSTDVARPLHTLKGSSGCLGLYRFVAACHRAETRLLEGAEEHAKILADLEASWEETYAGVVEPLMDSNDTVRVTKDSLRHVVAAIETGEHQRALAVIHSWSRPSMGALFESMSASLPERAARAGKGVVIEIEHGELHVPSAREAPFLQSLVHILRNAIAHGIESREQRLEQGKTPDGLIRIRCSKEERVFTVEITDDGRGVDWVAIAERARAMGLPSATRSDLLAALAAGGLTTQEEVGQLSGRGVGVGTVIERLRDLGGTYAVESSTGRGTTWKFSFEAALGATALS